MLMYPYGAPSVKCAVCHYITNVNMSNGRDPVPVRPNGTATSASMPSTSTAQFSQMRPVAMAPTIMAPRMPMYPPGAPGMGQQLFYGQAPTAIIPPQIYYSMVPRDAAAVMAQPMPITALASALANAPAEQQRTMLGENLYPLVDQLEHEHVAKVTGMLLEMDQTEVLHLLESPDALKAKQQQQQANNSPVAQLASLSLNENHVS